MSDTTNTTVVIGQAGRPFGIRGEIKIKPFTESPEAFKRSRVLYFDDTPLNVVRTRIHKGAVLALVEGIGTPEEASALQGCLVRTDPKNLPPKDEDEFYWFELVDMEVTTTDGRYLGRIVEVIPTGANDVIIVQGPYGEVLLPMIDDVVKEIDEGLRKMIVDPLEGLVPDA